MRMLNDRILRFAILIRAQVQLDLRAAMLGVKPSDFFAVWPRTRRAVARRAIQDVRDAAAGRLLNSGMTDAEAMQEARLWQVAWAQPGSQEGYRRAEQARLERARIRERGMARVRAREAAQWRAQEAAE